MKTLCIFCGSRPGTRPEYAAATVALAEELCRENWKVVFGGARVGLMGILADAVIRGGGEIIGIMPKKLLDKEVRHLGVKDFREVESMHARKKLMADLSDAFIALPGGFGTLDELFEMLTWNQIGQHSKPIGILNTLSYFDPLFEFLDHSFKSGFLSQEMRELPYSAKTPAELVAFLKAKK